MMLGGEKAMTMVGNVSIWREPIKRHTVKARYKKIYRYIENNFFEPYVMLRAPLLTIMRIVPFDSGRFH